MKERRFNYIRTCKYCKETFDAKTKLSEVCPECLIKVRNGVTEKNKERIEEARKTRKLRSLIINNPNLKFKGI